jgi:signal transduction histidine kinase
MKEKLEYQVIIIEKQEQMQKLLVSSFKRLGFDAVVFENANDAIQKIEDDEKQIGLVFCDVSLEGMTAFEFCEQLRLKYSMFQLPFILKMENRYAQSIHQGFLVGCNDFIQIPFDFTEFTYKINNLINQKKMFEDNQYLTSVMNLRTQVFKMNLHDLKNPLSSIFSLSGIPVTAFADNEEISQTLRIVHDASKIMMTLVNQTIEYVTISNEEIRFKKELISVTALVNQIIEISEPLAKKKNQELITSYPEEDYFIFSDTHKIYRAINNILSNAIKFSEFNKRIWVTVEKSNDSKIRIIIKDEGPGFRKEEIANVFTKFGKHSAIPTGDEISTGLGLLITKQIVNYSNGEIFLESEEGKGATFTIEFNQANTDNIQPTTA